MGESFKHLVIVKFKEDVVVEDVIKGMESLVSEIDSVKSFEWYMYFHFSFLFVCYFDKLLYFDLIINGLLVFYYRGQDVESLDILRQGFTHAFLMTFNKKEDFTEFQTNPKHVEFSATFSTVIDKIVLLDFPSLISKSPA